MHDERSIYVVLVVAGALPVIGALADGSTFGAGVTVSFLMVLVGAIGLVSGSWRLHDAAPPEARIQRTRRRISR